MEQAGCPRVPPGIGVGSGPGYTAFDPGNETLYVPKLFDGTVSLVSTGP
jgi:DNA-binding beta-propeller fold protein YncE